LSLAPASRAQSPPSDRDRGTADTLLKQARPLLVKGDYAAACPKLAASLELVATASLRINIAQCHEHYGKLTAALLDYQVALRLNERTPDAKRRQVLEKIAQDGLAALEARLPKLRIVIADPPAGLRVTRDGQEVPVAALGDALRLDPGPYDLEATAPGFEAVKQTVTMIEGQTTKVLLTLTALAPPPVVPEPAPAVIPPPMPSEVGKAPDRARKIAGFTLVGAGGAGFIVGTVAGAMAIAQYRSVAPLCPGGGCRPPQQPAMDVYHTEALVSTVGFIAGATAAAAGIVILATTPKARPASTLRITPYVGLGSVGARGRF
jgi:hypothetical protein